MASMVMSGEETSKASPARRAAWPVVTLFVVLSLAFEALTALLTVRTARQQTAGVVLFDLGVGALLAAAVFRDSKWAWPSFEPALALFVWSAVFTYAIAPCAPLPVRVDVAGLFEALDETSRDLAAALAFALFGGPRPVARDSSGLPSTAVAASPGSSSYVEFGRLASRSRVVALYAALEPLGAAAFAPTEASSGGAAAAVALAALVYVGGSRWTAPYAVVTADDATAALTAPAVGLLAVAALVSGAAAATWTTRSAGERRLGSVSLLAAALALPYALVLDDSDWTFASWTHLDWALLVALALASHLKRDLRARCDAFLPTPSAAAALGALRGLVLLLAVVSSSPPSSSSSAAPPPREIRSVTTT